jgi:hypothetical protein
VARPVVTLLDTRTAQPVAPEAQLLFQEARQRRRRRRLIAGITAIGLVAILVLTLLLSGLTGRGAPASPLPSAPSTGGMVASASAFSIRPVLCYAPAYAGSGATGTGTSSGSLPNCGPSYALTASNLRVHPGPGPFSNNAVIGPDPQFARIPSTSTAGDASASTVLLPGAGSTGPTRYVLGPAALTAADVRSAGAKLSNGLWIVNIRFTAGGSVSWDRLNYAQFHALIGVVWNGHVVSAPLVQPTQTSYTSFNGRGQISGGFTEHEAKAIAAGI